MSEISETKDEVDRIIKILNETVDNRKENLEEFLTRLNNLKYFENLLYPH